MTGSSKRISFSKQQTTTGHVAGNRRARIALSCEGIPELLHSNPTEDMMNLDELFQLYKQNKTLRPATIKIYECVIRRVVAECGNHSLEDFDEAVFLALRMTMLKRVKAVTWNNVRRHLKALFNFAVEHELIVANPLRRIHSAREPRAAPKCIDSRFIKNIHKYIWEGAGYREKNGRHRRLNHVWFWVTFVNVLYYTGMRLRQSLELEWRDINFETGELELREEGNKTKYQATVPIRPELLTRLRDLRDRSRDINATSVQSNMPIFQIHLFNGTLPPMQVRGSPYMTQGNVKKFFQGYSALAGIRISPHRIRHTTATELARKSNNPKAVMHQMGQTNYSTYLKYVHPNIDDLTALQTFL
jgi:integrase